MNIALLLFNMGLDKPAGSCPYTKELAEALGRRGHNVYIIADRSNKPIKLKYSKLIHLDTKPFGSWVNCFSDPRRLNETICVYTDALLKLDHEVNLDIVNVQHLLLSPIPAIFAQQFGHFKTVGTCHGSETYESRGNRAMLQFMQIASKLNGVTTDSQTIIEDITTMTGVKKNQVQIASTGVDTKKFTFDKKKRNSFRKTNQLNKEDAVVLFAGRLIEEKGVKWLPKLVEKARNTNKNIKFIIAGDGCMKNFLENQLSFYIKNQSVRILGPISQDELLKFYQLSDIFILPSIWNEPFAMVSLEAMSCSLPLVVTNKGGVASILIKEKILPYQPSPNFNSFYNNLMLLVNNPTLRIAFGKRLRSFVEERYSWDVVAEKFEKIYETL